MTYGYCRISTPQQNIERQRRSILTFCPSAKLYQEAYTGTEMNRPEWNKLMKIVHAGDTILFDSVSRMSRNADEGAASYFELYDRGVNLVFLNERYIDSSVYSNNLKDRIELTGTDEDEIFKGINNYFRRLAARQIRIAFEQSQKEHDDLVERTKGGIQTAKISGKQIGRPRGTGGETEKSRSAKMAILKHSIDYGGSLPDSELIKLIGISRNSYYKYKREIKADLIRYNE